MSTTRNNHFLAGVLALAVTLVAVGGSRCAGQTRPDGEPFEDVPIEIVTAVVERFDKTIRLGTGEGALVYREALVLTLEVERKAMDALPPSPEPFLYIGSREYRIFETRRGSSEDRLRLVFHLRDWQDIEDGAPIVLTIHRGLPQREPQRFATPEAPRFEKSAVVDKRENP